MISILSTRVGIKPEKKEEKLDKINEEKQKEWFKELNKDLYLGEAVEILNDTIKIEN